MLIPDPYANSAKKKFDILQDGWLIKMDPAIGDVLKNTHNQPSFCFNDIAHLNNKKYLISAQRHEY